MGKNKKKALKEAFSFNVYKLREIDGLIFFLHNCFVNEVFCCLFTFTNTQGQLHSRVYVILQEAESLWV